VAAAATSVLTSPTTDIATNAPHGNVFLVDPNLEEINYEEEEEDNEEEEEDEDRDYSPNKDLYKSNLFASYDDNVSLGLSQYRVPSARGVGSGHQPNAGRPDKPDTAGMSEQEASFALLQWQASWNLLFCAAVEMPCSFRAAVEMPNFFLCCRVVCLLPHYQHPY
jgi:hypothetical protein